MNWQMIGSIADTLAAAGVIVSLFYLAIQIRSSTRATRRTNAHELNSGSGSFYIMLADSDKAATIWHKGLIEPDSLSLLEFMRFSVMLLHVTTLWEESYFAAKDKDVPEWAVYHDVARREYVSLPGYAKWFNERGYFYHEEFRKAIEKEIQEGAVKVASFYSKKDK